MRGNIQLKNDFHIILLSHGGNYRITSPKVVRMKETRRLNGASCSPSGLRLIRARERGRERESEGEKKNDLWPSFMSVCQ